MKTIFNKLLLLTLSSVLLWGCEKDETMVKVKAGTAAQLSASATTIVLTKPNLANTAVTFTFSKANFGYDAKVTNTLQLARKNTGFTSVKEFTLDPGVASKSFTVQEFNALLLSMNLATGIAGDIDVRIKSSVSAAVAEVYSNVTAIKVTPFALVEQLYMAGQYQGWNPGTADSLTSATGNGVYVGIIQLDASASKFKLLKKKTWGAPEYGQGASLSTIAVGGADITGPTTSAPYLSENFQITADLNANTIAYEVFSWGLIGDATAGGWNDDTNMKYNNTTKKWTITTNLIGGKEFKFRKNHNWGTNLGGSGGTLSDGGSNIPIAVNGNYTIVLDATAKTYTLTKN